MGLKREKMMRGDMNYHLRRDFSTEEMQKLIGLWKESGMFASVQVEGERDAVLVLAEDVPTLETLEVGKVPKGWRPKEASTLEEVTFLSPLDIVSARGRAMKLFDFEYKWEVYTPLHKRRWGYYVLPILYGDDLVARADMKLDRTTMTLHVLGFWLEDDAPRDAAFADALANGLKRFAEMTAAIKVNVSGIKLVALRRHVKLKLSASNL
jgi:uncharacterized protein YcaQ